MVNVVVNHGRQQIVGKRDGIEVTREVQVNVLHWNDLGLTAACGAALHAKYGPQGGLAQANHRTFSNVVQRVSQTHCGGCLTLAGRCWTDRCDQNQFTVWTITQSINKVQRNFGFGPTKRF